MSTTAVDLHLPRLADDRLEPGAAGAFMRRLGPAIDATFGRPRAILALSAHTMTREPVLLAAPRHEAIYDFGGFDPAALHLALRRRRGPRTGRTRGQSCWPTRASPSHRVADGGLDHGIWTPLR